MKKVVLLVCVMVVSGFASCAEYRRLYSEARLKYYSISHNCGTLSITGGNANTPYCKNLRNVMAKYQYLVDECDRQDEMQKQLYEINKKLNELNGR